MSKKILMADDDADDRNLALIAFRELNVIHTIDFVTDGQELIDDLLFKITCNTALPDVILLDLNMPKKDGRVALKEIKSHEKLNHLNVIIFSTSSSIEDISYVKGLGAKRYITKPAGYIELVSIFKNICDELTQTGV